MKIETNPISCEVKPFEKYTWITLDVEGQLNAYTREYGIVINAYRNKVRDLLSEHKMVTTDESSGKEIELQGLAILANGILVGVPSIGNNTVCCLNQFSGTLSDNTVSSFNFNEQHHMLDDVDNIREAIVDYNNRIHNAIAAGAPEDPEQKIIGMWIISE